MSEELLPCPFCGDENPRMNESKRHDMYWVSCENCGLEAPSETGTTEEDAIAYWQVRSILRQPAAPVTDAMVEDACKAYAEATGYYVEFHRGLSSPSADKMRVGMRRALEAALQAGVPRGVEAGAGGQAHTPAGLDGSRAR